MRAVRIWCWVEFEAPIVLEVSSLYIRRPTPGRTCVTGESRRGNQLEGRHIGATNGVKVANEMEPIHCNSFYGHSTSGLRPYLVPWIVDARHRPILCLVKVNLGKQVVLWIPRDI